MATSLEESGRLAGAHRWVERRMFEVLGGWVPSTAEPQAKLLFDRHSEHHAWRAAQWWERLPVLAGADREALTAPSGAIAAALDRLAGLTSPVARMAGAYRVVLPRIWSDYERHRSRADAVADGSALRTLTIVTADLVADWREGEMVLQTLIVDAPSADEAASAIGAVEKAFVCVAPA